MVNCHAVCSFVLLRIVDGDSAGVVIDGDSPDLIDVDYTDEHTAVTVQFYGFNSQTCGGISEYEWAVGVANNEGNVVKEAVMPFTTYGIVTLDNPGSGYAQSPIPNLSSFVGIRLYISVRGITDCGDVLESISDGFVILTRPPTLQLHDARMESDSSDQSRTGSSIYQSTSPISISWDVSGQSNIRKFVSIGSYPGGEDMKEKTEVFQNYFQDNIPSSAEGIPVFVTVTAVNEAGLEAIAISNAFVMDTTPPIVEVVSQYMYKFIHACQ